MRFSFLLLLLLSVSISISISPVTCDTHICPQGGQPPVECPLENQHHWDNVACRWVCNSPVQCLVDPCDDAVRDGICSRAGCKADYSFGCNFKCSKCLKSTCDTARCASGTECVQDEQCHAQCKPTSTSTPTGVQCLINPCENAARDGICPLKSCVADYSKGCHFKCSKCSLTCATVKCAGGTECVQDEECNIECRPLILPTPTPTPSCLKVCRANCIKGFSCQTDSNGCKKCLPTPTPTPTGVQCLVDPCDAAVRDGICSRAGCTADYSTGCNFKCSKCLKSTCDTARCQGGYKCVQDQQCNAICKRV